MEYLVEWCIELKADSPKQAARDALAIQRDPNSTATVFNVMDVEGSIAGDPIRIDLQALDDDDDLTNHGVLDDEAN